MLINKVNYLQKTCWPEREELSQYEGWDFSMPARLDAGPNCSRILHRFQWAEITKKFLDKLGNQVFKEQGVQTISNDLHLKFDFIKVGKFTKFCDLSSWTRFVPFINLSYEMCPLTWYANNWTKLKSLVISMEKCSQCRCIILVCLLRWEGF